MLSDDEAICWREITSIVNINAVALHLRHVFQYLYTPQSDRFSIASVVNFIVLQQYLHMQVAATSGRSHPSLLMAVKLR